TLSTDAVDGIPPTVAAAVRDGRPWVLDPTAIGIAPVRTPLARGLLGSRPTVVRGNASEVLALVAAGRGGRGPDSSASDADGDAVETAAQQVAALTGGTVSVSGEVDLVLDSERSARVARGTALLTRVTGTGCLLGALTAACSAVHPVPFEAAEAAAVWLDLAGERAAARATGPGSFRMQLLDALDEVGRGVERWPHDTLRGARAGTWTCAAIWSPRAPGAAPSRPLPRRRPGGPGWCRCGRRRPPLRRSWSSY